MALKIRKRLLSGKEEALREPIPGGSLT